MDNPEEEEEEIQQKIETKQIHKFKQEKAIKTTDQQIAGHVDAAKRDVVTISLSLRGSLLCDHSHFQGGQGREHSPDQRFFADDGFSPYMNNNARVLDGSPFSQQPSPDLYNSRDDHYAQRSSVCALDSKVNTMGNHAHPFPGQGVVFRILCPIEKVDRVMEEPDGMIELIRNDVGVAKANVGCFLGKGRKVIEQMRIETKTQIRVLPRDHTLPQCVAMSEVVLQIAGHVDAVKRALVIISLRLRESQLGDRSHFQGGQGRAHSPDQHFFADDEFFPYMNNNACALDEPPFSQQPSPALSYLRNDIYAQRSSVNALDSKSSTMGNHAHLFSVQGAVFRIFCPIEKVDIVLVESDGVIELLRNDFGVNIWIVDPEPGSDERIIMIYLDEIAGHVDAEKRDLVTISSSLRGSLLCDHSHFQGGQGREHSPDQRFFADDGFSPYMNNNARALDGPPFSQQPSSALSNFRNDNYAQRSSVCAIDSKVNAMGNHAHPFPGQDVVFRILFPTEKVDRVMGEIDGIMELIRNDVGVAKANVGCFLGKGRKVIEQMRVETKTQIRVLPRDHTLPQCVAMSEVVLQIVGQVDAAKRASVLISSRLRESQLRDCSHFQGCQGGQERAHSQAQRFFADDEFPPYTNNNARALDGPPFSQQPAPALSSFGNDNYAQRLSVHALDSKASTMGNHALPFSVEDAETDGLLNDVGVETKIMDPEPGSDERIIIATSDEVPNSSIHGTTVIIFLNKNIIKVFIDGRQVYESVFITQETTKKFTVIRKKVIVCYAGDVKEGIAVLNHLKASSAAKKFVVSADAVKDLLLSTYEPKYDQETDVIICGFRPSGDPYIHHVLIQKTKPRLKLMPSKNNKFRVFGSGGDKVRMHFNDVDDSYKDVDEQIEVGVAMASVRDANTGGYFFKIEMRFDLKEIISKPSRERSVIYLKKHFYAWKNQNYVFLLYNREEQPVSYFERWIKSKFYNGKFPAKPKIIFELSPIGRAIPSRLAFGVAKFVGPMLVDKVCSQGKRVSNRKFRSFNGFDIREYLYEKKAIYAARPSQEFLDRIQIQGFDEYKKADKLAEELEKSGKK